MELFTEAKAVKLRNHLGKYLVSDEYPERIRMSGNGSSRKARWFVELVESNPHVIRLRSCHGRYLTAGNDPILLGLTGSKVVPSEPDKTGSDLSIEWQPIREGLTQVKLKAYRGTYLRANGGTPPWRNTVTHDLWSHGSSHHQHNDWMLWEVEAVEVPEDESLTDYLWMVSNNLTVSNELIESELGSPVSVDHAIAGTPRWFGQKSAMLLFHNAKAVRLRSHHGKYLLAHDDGTSVTQHRDGSSNNARWFVELACDDGGFKTTVRLKSSHGKYLTASDHPFLLGLTGRKVLQTLPGRLDSSVEWEPIREGNRVKLRTRYGQFLRANGGLPPWRNSVTHDIPYRTVTRDWILWDVEVVETSSAKSLPPEPSQPEESSVPNSDSLTSESASPSTQSKNSTSSREEWSDSLNSTPKSSDGRLIFYHVGDEFGNVDEGVDELCIAFSGNGVEELTRRLEQETGLKEIVVCSRSPLNGKLYPLRLQLPPNKVAMNVVIVQASPRGRRRFV